MISLLSDAIWKTCPQKMGRLYMSSSYDALEKPIRIVQRKRQVFKSHPSSKSRSPSVMPCLLKTPLNHDHLHLLFQRRLPLLPSFRFPHHHTPSPPLKSVLPAESRQKLKSYTPTVKEFEVSIAFTRKNSECQDWVKIREACLRIESRSSLPKRPESNRRNSENTYYIGSPAALASNPTITPSLSALPRTSAINLFPTPLP